MASCIATFHDYCVRFLSAINFSDVSNPTIYKVKWNEIQSSVPAAQQDCAGGLKHSWCRACTLLYKHKANKHPRVCCCIL